MKVEQLVCNASFSFFQRRDRTDGQSISRQVALWSQKNAKEEGEAVVWDYHVILALHRRASCTPSDLRLAEKQQERADSWVYDFDCVLPMPQLLDRESPISASKFKRNSHRNSYRKQSISIAHL